MISIAKHPRYRARHVPWIPLGDHELEIVRVSDLRPNRSGYTGTEAFFTSSDGSLYVWAWMFGEARGFANEYSAHDLEKFEQARACGHGRVRVTVIHKTTRRGSGAKFATWSAP